jgi:hypothetical protein
LIKLEDLFNRIRAGAGRAGVGVDLGDFAEEGDDGHFGQAHLIDKEHQAEDYEQNNGDSQCEGFSFHIIWN